MNIAVTWETRTRDKIQSTALPDHVMTSVELVLNHRNSEGMSSRDWSRGHNSKFQSRVDKITDLTRQEIGQGKEFPDSSLSSASDLGQNSIFESRD